MTIRSNVEFILEVKGMTKSELADLLGVDLSGVYRYLDGNNIGLKTICAIAKALEVKPSDLIATPSLRARKNIHEETNIQETPKPVKVSMPCPCCGTRLSLTIEKDLK